MNTKTITVVEVGDVFKEYGLVPYDAHNLILESDVSYGTNDDTLVSLARLCDILGIKIKSEHDGSLLVSLGA